MGVLVINIYLYVMLSDIPLDKKKFEKIVNSKIILKNYPVIDHIEITKWDMNDRNEKIRLKIIVKDKTMKALTIYEKGLDVHYLIDYYLHNLLASLGMPTKLTEYIGFVVVDEDNNEILSWVHNGFWFNHVYPE
jgi:hypothetical protein